MKTIVNILRRLAFVILFILFMFCSILITFLYILIVSPLCWIFTGEMAPDYYLEDYREQWLKYVTKVLPNNEGDKII